MVSRLRLPGLLTVGLLALVLMLTGVFALGGAAAESTNSETQYLPLVMQPKSPTPTPTPTPTPPAGEFEQQVVVLTNQQRANHGCGPVTLETRLLAAAEGHSEDMALNDFFSHTGSNGSSPWDRIHAQGYTYWTAGENIAAGYNSPERVVTGWMNSSGHRANILNCDFVHIGVGYYYLQNDTGSENWHHYWTQVFASPSE